MSIPSDCFSHFYLFIWPTKCRESNKSCHYVLNSSQNLMNHETLFDWLYYICAYLHYICTYSCFVLWCGTDGSSYACNGWIGSNETYQRGTYVLSQLHCLVMLLSCAYMTCTTLSYNTLHNTTLHYFAIAKYTHTHFYSFLSISFLPSFPPSLISFIIS